ncbi:hypothetical protein SGLAM104S_09592 [Streptomyces glaucescens]
MRSLQRGCPAGFTAWCDLFFDPASRGQPQPLSQTLAVLTRPRPVGKMAGAVGKVR